MFPQFSYLHLFKCEILILAPLATPASVAALRQAISSVHSTYVKSICLSSAAETPGGPLDCSCW